MSIWLGKRCSVLVHVVCFRDTETQGDSKDSVCRSLGSGHAVSLRAHNW